MIQIIEALYPLNGEELEDVANAEDHFHVGLILVDGVSAFGQLEVHRVCDVHGQSGIILVCQLSPDALVGEVLAELELLEQWDAVEELAVQVPGD